MSDLDEHPEEWLDSAAADALSPGARRSLERHLAECPACSAQMAARRISRQTKSRERDARLDRFAVERALARTASRRLRPRRRSPRVWLHVGATVLVLASVAWATDWAAHRWNLRLLAWGRPERALVVAPVTSPRAPSATAVDEVAAPSPVSFAEPAPEPVVPGKVASAPRRPAPVKKTAAELFEEARELRRRGALDTATGVYRSLQRSFPESPEARLSYALLGRLFLERKQAEQALVQFDKYLATPGPVAEDAFAGRAVAFQHLNRPADEAAAWKTLLSRYPQSIYAGQARSRIRELGLEQGPVP